MNEGAAPAGSAAPEGPAPVPGLLAAAFEALRTRLELAAVELEIHLIGLARALVWAVATVLCALLALAFGVVAVISALWDTHRQLGLLAGALTFVLLAAVCAFAAARVLRRRTGILDDSLAELERDQRRAGTP